jgi:tetratricopeptide (TPR) repeat protein
MARANMQRGAGIRPFTALIGAAVFALICLQPVSGQQASHPAPNDDVAKTYNYHFGKDKPFSPGNPATESGDFIRPGAFPTAQYCQHCHQEAYSQWRQALHSNSFRSPFYRTSVNTLKRTKGIEYTRHCDSCHNPIAVLSGALTEDSHIDRSFDRDGVTCMVCHSIQRLDSTSGNGGYVMGTPAVMVDENGKRIPGEVPYEEIMAHADRHSQAVMQPIYRKPEFCAACHKANLPDALNDYRFLRAFTVYDEWQDSKFSKQTPIPFYTADFTTCQSCHMQHEPNVLQEYGAKNGTFASHRWLAGNTAVPFYYKYDEQLKQTVKFLQSGNYLNVDLIGLKKNNGQQLIAPLGMTPFSLAPEDTVETYVVIQNAKIGHSLIPEVRDLYEAWVEFSAQDRTGKIFYHSGFLEPDGTLDPRAHSFTNRPVDAKGTFVDNHKVWTIHSVAYDNTISAGRSTLVRYRFRIPSGVRGPITITAKVNYRHLRQSYLNNVLGTDHPAYPIVVLASRSRTLKIGENLPVPASPQDNPEWMRWNNLGIGYLDAQQYAQAVDAFNRVVQLRPDYADGYTNIAVTESLWEKFGSAKAAVDKALAISPGNARALFYAGMLERRAGNADAEAADLEAVVEQYPKSRDALRELGITFFQQTRYEEAMHVFQQLQKVDPDDLAAHYNLSILYRRMGKKADAEREQALFIDEKFDPGSPTYSLDYLQQHPEVVTESIPWHVHTDGDKELGHSTGKGN